MLYQPRHITARIDALGDGNEVLLSGDFAQMSMGRGSRIEMASHGAWLTIGNFSLVHALRSLAEFSWLSRPIDAPRMCANTSLRRGSFFLYLIFGLALLLKNSHS